MVSSSEIVGIDALVWKPEIQSWTVCILIYEYYGYNHGPNNKYSIKVAQHNFLFHFQLLVEVFEGGEDYIREISVANCKEKCPERCRSFKEEDFIEKQTFSKRFSLEFKHLECCSG